MLKRTLLFLLLSCALASLVAAAAATNDEAATWQRGRVELESAGELAFAPDGVLLVGDSMAGTLWAIDVEDPGKAEPGADLQISGIDEKIAAALGTTPRELLINDLAVHRQAQAVYLSVSRGRGDDAVPALVRIGTDGSIDTVDLSNRRYSRYVFEDAPSRDATDRRGRSQRVLTITDLAYHDGQVYVAGLSNQEFASSLRRVPYPFQGKNSSTSLEIYHGAHGQYETHAPIRTLVPYDVDGEPHFAAGYTCTPLVTFPANGLEDGKHLKATTVAELGFGNSPLDMLVYEKDGEDYLLIVNNRRSGMRIKIADIVAAESITKSEDAVTYGVDFVPLPLGGILHLDFLNDETLVAVRRDLESGALDLYTSSRRYL